MPFDKIDIESINDERRKSIAKFIRPVSIEELKKIGDEVFHDLDDPWRDTCFQFIEQHSHTTIHHATSADGVHFLYSREEDRGIGFCPEAEKGSCQQRGGRMMKEAIGG